MEKQHHSWPILKTILIFLFIIFIINYFNVQNGYYEAKNSERASYINKKKEEFEQDIQNGQEIDLKNYTEQDYIDNSSPIGDLGYKFSNKVNEIMTSKALTFFTYLSKLFS